ncbi:unnamed protein product, partial [Tetraodon nigroviridis]
IVELFPAVPINPHWGIVSKCLPHTKAARTPRVLPAPTPVPQD